MQTGPACSFLPSPALVAHLAHYRASPAVFSPAHHMPLWCGSRSPTPFSSIAWGRFRVGPVGQTLLPPCSKSISNNVTYKNAL
jgi:hypothetical protein